MSWYGTHKRMRDGFEPDQWQDQSSRKRHQLLSLHVENQPPILQEERITEVATSRDSLLHDHEHSTTSSRAKTPYRGLQSLFEEEDWAGLEYNPLPPLRPVPKTPPPVVYTGPIPARPHEQFEYDHDKSSQDDLDAESDHNMDEEIYSGDSIEDQELWCPRPASNMSTMTTETLNDIDSSVLNIQDRGKENCRPQRLHAFYHPCTTQNPPSSSSSTSPDFSRISS